ncbi:MAG: geranylgeranyl reductase [Hyphomonadaceae bacterium]|nr:MAG: geranylgeranyl reductase [Hyphomonadaceae bacterium]KAF0183598.1 MAG: geranylgeranyl reductase [Hyphomonadaceae bacterium]
MIADICIVGLGPAGAEAARICAGAGLSVIAVERKKQAGLPVQCAEFVPSLLSSETLEAFHNSVQLIDDMVTFVENDAPHNRETFSGRMIDRAKFDAALVANARRAGANIILGENVVEISKNGEISLANGQKIQAKIIIGADGPHSIIGQAIGQINRECLETRQITVELKNPQTSTDIYLSHKYKGGYAWVFPKGKIANIGLGLHQSQKSKLKPLLEELWEQLREQSYVGSEIMATTGGAIPVGGMLRPFGHLGEVLVLLAGDAAGLTNPITGAGIPAAVVSGVLAGQAAIASLKGDESAATNYEEELEDLFGTSLHRARRHYLRLLAIHENGGKPNKLDLKKAWIAFPEYWENQKNMNEIGQEHDLLEA